jgi:hypothetical protein
MFHPQIDDSSTGNIVITPLHSFTLLPTTYGDTDKESNHIPEKDILIFLPLPQILALPVTQVQAPHR